jgi:hypothetical protein
MGQKRVIVTVDRRKIDKMDEVLQRLRQRGLQVDQLDTVLDVTQIVGRYDGDLKQLNSDGVVAELEGWMTEQSPNQEG